jgi:hypothetical protein
MISPRITPSDVAASVIYYADSKFLTADPRKLHRAIQLAQEVCPLLRKTFQFSSRGVGPVSRSFDQALAVLKLSRIVRMENTDYERYIIDEEARTYVKDRVLPLFSPEEKRSLASAAKIVREVCEGTVRAGVEAEVEEAIA